MNTAVWLLSVWTIVSCVTVGRQQRGAVHIVSKTRVQLKPIEIKCSLTDMLLISAPIININEAFYYLTRPNGDTVKLNITHPRYRKHKHRNLSYLNEYDNLQIKFLEQTRTIIIPVSTYDVFNLNIGATENSPDILGDKLKSTNDNDFLLGPLDHEDHGNWVLSVYFKDENHDWAEVYQLFSIHIIETVPAYAANPTLKPGDDFQLKFAYPIKYLESCELNVPSSSFDRFYDRSRLDPESCGYVVKNVTRDDTGVWKIIGVGRILYVATVYLRVEEKAH